MKIVVKKYSHPILTPGVMRGQLFAPDALWAYHPVVVQPGTRTKVRYYMFYTGKSIGLGISHHTLLATSNNLTDWKKEGSVVLPNGEEGEWDSDFTAHGFVFGEGETHSMLYDGSSVGDWLEEIGLAKSTDLHHWVKHIGNPVFTVGTSRWEKRHVSRSCVFTRNGTYYLYYAGHDGERERIGLATGKTIARINKRLPEPVLDLGNGGTWDEKSISDPRVIYWNGKFLMFYSGIDAKGIERTGIATSSDLIRWAKFSGNPILDVTPGAWDSISASRAFPFVENNHIRLFYSGRRKFLYHIGVAEVTIT
mgnify:CR=1 FL=1